MPATAESTRSLPETPGPPLFPRRRHSKYPADKALPTHCAVTPGNLRQTQRAMPQPLPPAKFAASECQKGSRVEWRSDAPVLVPPVKSARSKSTSGSRSLPIVAAMIEIKIRMMASVPQTISVLRKVARALRSSDAGIAIWQVSSFTLSLLKSFRVKRAGDLLQPINQTRSWAG